MARELTVITLKCAGCGAGLSISEDMTRFACGYCGTEQMVERKGGTVALKPVTDAIAKVQVGTDKTAAELALKRLPQELNYLIWQRTGRSAYWANQIATRNHAASNWLVLVFVFSFVFVIPALILISTSLIPSLGAGLIMGVVLGIAISSVLVFYTHRYVSVSRDSDVARIVRDSERELVAFDSQIRSMKEKIEENRRIANS